MQALDRYGYCIFCDDIRIEPGGKLSFLRCYNAVMVVDRPFPVMLPKLCFHVTVCSPANKPYSSLMARCYLPDEDKPVAEEPIEVPPPSAQLALLDSLPPGAEAPPYIVVSASLIIEPIEIRSAGLIHVRALIDGGPHELHLGSLHIRG
ncbi:hypothetical protein [Rhodopseudomonas sp.]|uniref:hypothetical protein n=1 Tax=Rhodopseudomonas sp. TaxID=1078 RepID=UPI003B3A62FB